MEKRCWDRLRRISLKKRMTFAFAALIFAILVSWLVFTNPFGMTDVKVVVEYVHQWSGAIGEGDVLGPISMTGNYSLVMHKMFGGKWIIHAMVEKEDNSTDVLKVSIETLDGKVLKSAMTIVPHEMIFVEVIL